MAYSAKTGAVKTVKPTVIILVAGIVAQVVVQVAQQAGVTIDESQLSIALTTAIGAAATFIVNWINNRPKKDKSKPAVTLKS